MKIKKCCERIEGILKLDFIDVNSDYAIVWMGGKANGHIMMYCPNCGKKIEFK